MKLALVTALALSILGAAPLAQASGGPQKHPDIIGVLKHPDIIGVLKHRTIIAV